MGGEPRSETTSGHNPSFQIHDEFIKGKYLYQKVCHQPAHSVRRMWSNEQISVHLPTEYQLMSGLNGPGLKTGLKRTGFKDRA